MARTENALTCCMLSNRLEPECYKGWTDDELATLQLAKQGNITPYMQVINIRLHNAGLYTIALYGILHDKDRTKIWDDEKCCYVETEETKHVHIDTAFATKIEIDKDGNKKKRSISNSTITNICNAIGFANEADIQKPERGRYAWDNMLSYLTHIKYDPSKKHHYEVTDVISFVANGENGKPLARTYEQIYNSNKAKWIEARGKIAKKQAVEKIDDIEYKILRGQINKEMLLKDDDLFEIYARNKRRCDEALNVYLERQGLLLTEAMFRREFKTTVIYITGRQGAGKTTYANTLAHTICDWSTQKYKLKWRIYDAAASNSMDDFMGEEIVMLDDLVGTSMRASDWLRLLDETKVNRASARYNNKVVACKVLIIVSKFDPVYFFSHLDKNDEPLDQFIRRLACVVRVINYHEMEYRGIVEERDIIYNTNQIFQGDNGQAYYYGRYHLDSVGWRYSDVDMMRRLLQLVKMNDLPEWEREADSTTD